MVLVREAIPDDNAGLLRLTTLTPMKGKISLRIDRNPSFFNLLNARGPSRVFVAEVDGKIAGSFSVSDIETFINGRRETVRYLADLKMLPDISGVVLVRLLKRMYDHLAAENADLLFCTAAYGNDKVNPLFQGRMGFPEFHFAGIFRVYQIIPMPGKVRSGNLTLRETEINDSIVEFYNSFYSGYDLAPVITGDSLAGTRTIAAFSGPDLKACLSLSDVSSSKQNVLMGLPSLLKFGVFLLGLVNKLVPFINLPETGKSVKVLYIKVFAFTPGHEQALEPLIRKARDLAYTMKYCYLTAGIHERDHSSRYFKKYFHFTFSSIGYLVSLHRNREKLNRILKGILYEDYSLV